MPRNPTELLIRELKTLVYAFGGSSEPAAQSLANLVRKRIEHFEADTEAAKKPRKAKE